MNAMRLVGVVLLVAGLVLLYFGFSARESLADQVSETLTGRYTDETMWYLIGGAVLSAVGAALALFGKG